MEFDYVIVGAGSAGCILANRLSASGKYTVGLIEAGGGDNSIFIKMPTALAIPMSTKKYNWGFQSAPEPYLGGRIIPCYRGRGLGGSSSINGMVFVRGHPQDIDEWESLGAAGWNYKNCLPYYRRLESWEGGADEYRGGDGPVAVTTGNHMQLSPLYQAFIDAGIEAGYPHCPDYNGENQEGFGPMQMNVDKGIRASTSRAYLRPARKRRNLVVLKNSLTQRVLIKDGKAAGIEVAHGGRVRKITARREVILSAGAIGSPQLLQVSGIGPDDVLQNAGINPIIVRPGVGENLTDHLEVFFQYQCTQPITLNNKLDPISKALIGLRWILRRDGLGATNHLKAAVLSVHPMINPGRIFNIISCPAPFPMTEIPRLKAMGIKCMLGRINRQAGAMCMRARRIFASIRKSCLITLRTRAICATGETQSALPAMCYSKVRWRLIEEPKFSREWILLMMRR